MVKFINSRLLQIARVTAIDDQRTWHGLKSVAAPHRCHGFVAKVIATIADLTAHCLFTSTIDFGVDAPSRNAKPN
jgi:hypothetical protein